MTQLNHLTTRLTVVCLLVFSIFVGASAAQNPEPRPVMPAGVKGSDVNDPRAKLAPGVYDAGQAAFGIKHVSLLKKPDAFQLGATDASDPRVKRTLSLLGAGDGSQMPPVFQLLMAQLAFANSDLAFQGDHLFMGNFHGMNIYDISKPASAKLLTSIVCPGGQGDVSVFKTLMFMSVEMPNGRVDCGTQGIPVTEGAGKPGPAASKDRFRGVRIFDISDIQNPKQVAAVQTCRGSHTHTLLVSPNDKENVYIYVSGTSFVRPPEELEGCSGGPPEKDPNTARFRIEVIKVPLAAPQDAKVVSTPRIFADQKTGNIAGLKTTGSHEDNEPALTDQCHDITVYPEIGLAAGACSGHGILLDIKDPANPKRLDAVSDKNYAYWHSAAFSNDGKKVVYTDEWGGGMSPRCREKDPNIWGANAIFRLSGNELSFASYYKMPAAQTETENCVAHNGSLIPVPGRDIKVQAWYQGGISIMDFTDPAKPVEIAYFDRGPIDAKIPVMGGHWSAYWYNGYIYGSEIARGLDIFELTPTKYLSQNEIDAAKSVRMSRLNVQMQERIEWPNKVAVAKAYIDQLERSGSLSASEISKLRRSIEKAESSNFGTDELADLRKLANSLETTRAHKDGVNATRIQTLASILKSPVG